VDFLAQPPLRANAKAIADDQHPDQPPPTRATLSFSTESRRSGHLHLISARPRRSASRALGRVDPLPGHGASLGWSPAIVYMGGSALVSCLEADEIVVMGYPGRAQDDGHQPSRCGAPGDTRFPPPYRASADCVVSESTRARRLLIFKARVRDIALADEFIVGRDPAEHHAREGARVAVRDALLATA
jgi:hypothetical protein